MIDPLGGLFFMRAYVVVAYIDTDDRGALAFPAGPLPPRRGDWPPRLLRRPCPRAARDLPSKRLRLGKYGAAHASTHVRGAVARGQASREPHRRVRADPRGSLARRSCRPSWRQHLYPRSATIPPAPAEDLPRRRSHRHRRGAFGPCLRVLRAIQSVPRPLAGTLTRQKPLQTGDTAGRTPAKEVLQIRMLPCSQGFWRPSENRGVPSSSLGLAIKLPPTVAAGASS
jgi:hypothetical protein